MGFGGGLMQMLNTRICAAHTGAVPVRMQEFFVPSMATPEALKQLLNSAMYAAYIYSLCKRVEEEVMPRRVILKQRRRTADGATVNTAPVSISNRRCSWKRPVCSMHANLACMTAGGICAQESKSEAERGKG